MRSLEFADREVQVGEQRLDNDVLGRRMWTGGLRLDIAARDERGRLVAIEAQLGDSDHAHLGAAGDIRSRRAGRCRSMGSRRQRAAVSPRAP
jgi:hypothetical protein